MVRRVRVSISFFLHAALIEAEERMYDLKIASVCSLVLSAVVVGVLCISLAFMVRKYRCCGSKPVACQAT